MEKVIDKLLKELESSGNYNKQSLSKIKKTILHYGMLVAMDFNVKKECASECFPRKDNSERSETD